MRMALRKAYVMAPHVMAQQPGQLPAHATDLSLVNSRVMFCRVIKSQLIVSAPLSASMMRTCSRGATWCGVVQGCVRHGG